MKRIVLILAGTLLTASAFAELTVGPARHGQCTLYQHRDMQGAHLTLRHGDRVSFASEDVGNTTWSERPRWNDHVSSARIDAHCTLRVWEHMKAEGAMKEWSGGRNGLLVKYVGDRWNDRVSSAVCFCN